MAARPVAWEGVTMAEVVIRLQRPALMTAEVRMWLGQRVGEGQPMVALGRLERSDHGELLLRVEVADQSVSAAEHDLADLMTDMRLLGLRPALARDGLGRGSPKPDDDSASRQPSHS